MSVLFFCGNAKGAGEQIQNLIEAKITMDQIERYRTIKNLSNRFRQPRGDLVLMVLLVASQEELVDLLLIRNQFDDIPVILILPDRESVTISKGHKLYPRFISYIDGNFSDLDLVLTKMINHSHLNEQTMMQRIRADRYFAYPPR